MTALEVFIRNLKSLRDTLLPFTFCLSQILHCRLCSSELTDAANSLYSMSEPASILPSLFIVYNTITI